MVQERFILGVRGARTVLQLSVAMDCANAVLRLIGGIAGGRQ
jgi:hypothetical protein